MTIANMSAIGRTFATRRNGLFLITFLGFALRVISLGAQSLWYDEAFSAWLAAKPFAEISARTASDIHPPLYYYTLALWTPLVGQSEFSLRFLSLCAGVLSLPLLFHLGKRLLGEVTAWVVLLLAAFSPMYVWYSQEARMYAALILLVIASAYVFWRWLDKPSWPLWAGWVSLSVLAVYLHFYAFFALAAQFAYFLYWWMRQETRWAVLGAGLAGIAAVGAAFVPWARFALVRYAADESYFEGTLQWGEVLRKTAIMFATGHTVLEAEALLPALVFVSLSFIGWLVGPRLRPDAMNLQADMPFRSPLLTGAAARMYLLLWLVLPFLLLWLISYGRPKFHPRYLLVASPAFLMLVAAAVASFWRSFWNDQKKGVPRQYVFLVLAAGAAVVVASASLSGLVNLYSDPRFSKDDFRGAIQKIRENRDPGEPTILVSGHMFPIYEYYDPGHRYVPLPDDETLSTRRVLGYQNANDLNTQLSGATGAWLLLWQDDVVDPAGFVRTILDTNAKRIDSGSFWGVDLLRYSIPPGVIFSDKPNIANKLELTFGGVIRLLGYNPAPSPRPADSGIEVTFFWRALEDLDQDFKVRLRAYDREGHAVGELDARPATYNYPTSRWRAGDTVFGSLVVPLEAGTPPGEYQIEVLVYAEGGPGPLEVYDAAGTTGRTVLLEPTRVERAAKPPPLEKIKPKRGMRYSVAGVIDLIGYELARTSGQPGEPLELTMFWRATGTPTEDYRLLLMIARTSSPTDSFTGDNPVDLVGGFATTQWRSGDVIKAHYTFYVPPDAADGDRAIRVSILDKAGKNVGAPVSLGTITIEPSTRNFRAPPQLRVVDNVRFGTGELMLYGYDTLPSLTMQGELTPTVSVAGGDTLRVLLWWRSVQRVRTAYKVFVHVRPEGAPLVAQHDSAPVRGDRPTPTWVPGEYLLDTHEVQLPSDIKPGNYVLEVGLYDARTNQRLPVQGPSPQATAFQLRVRVVAR